MPNTPPQNEMRSWFEEPIRNGGGDRRRDATSGGHDEQEPTTPSRGSRSQPDATPQQATDRPGGAPAGSRTDPVLNRPAQEPDAVDPEAETVRPGSARHQDDPARRQDTAAPAEGAAPAEPASPAGEPGAAGTSGADTVRSASGAADATDAADPVETADAVADGAAGDSGPGGERGPAEAAELPDGAEAVDVLASGHEDPQPEHAEPSDTVKLERPAPPGAHPSREPVEPQPREHREPPDSEATMPAPQPVFSPRPAASAPPTAPAATPAPASDSVSDSGAPGGATSATQPMAHAQPTVPVPGASPAGTPTRREEPEDVATEALPIVPPPAQSFDRRHGAHAGPDSDTTTELPRIAASVPRSPQSRPDPEPDPRQQPRYQDPRYTPSHHPEPPAGDPSGHRDGPPPFGAVGNDRRRMLVRGGIVAAAVLGFFGLLYGIDLATSRGEVPRGVMVGGVSVGGMQPTAAEQRLRDQLEPRLNRPVALRAGDVDTRLDPQSAGLTLDWPATLDQAGTQPLNPWTRLVSLFTHREVGVVTSGDEETLTTALVGLLPQIDREPAEGTIRFEGADPIPVDPRPGQRLDVGKASQVVLDTWANGGVLQLPVVTTPVKTTPEGVRATLRDVVEPAVSGPVTVTGEGANAVLEPEEIAGALRFAPDDKGGLTTTVDRPSVIGAVGPDLAGTEKQGKDAEIVLQGGTPVVLPSVEGRAIDWDKSLVPLDNVLRNTGGERRLPAVYADQHPKLTTEQANQLGITSQISSFTTEGFAQDSGQNIKRVAEQVSGAVVKPGETFSLNGFTGPRTAAAGYVEAGIIDHGRPGRGIGGGISQFATTLFNASYFAGMTDVEHKEHSYYISRYPAAREATVFEGAIDVKFRNDSPTGVLVQTSWTPSSITVTFWGTKHVDVESITGPRTNVTPPETKTVHGEPCSASPGSPGFTTTDTRVVRDSQSGAEVSRRTRTVVYHPQPKVICEPGPPAPGG